MRVRPVVHAATAALLLVAGGCAQVETVGPQGSASNDGPQDRRFARSRGNRSARFAHGVRQREKIVMSR